MRSKFLVCTAIAAAGMSSAWFGPVAHAASSKRAAAAHQKEQKAQKEKDAKSSELRADDKSMTKQLQWEDKVMGPDSKRAELDKIARAHAITEKAEKDKERQAALEAAAPAPKPEKAKKTEVALPSMADETSNAKPSSKSSADEGRGRDISPKLETAAAQAPVPASKPADDKFIDKLLREEDAPSKKRASANDKELESLLAGAKDKPAAGHKRADSVDSLLKNADKGPAMPAPRAQSGLPEWAKQPEIASSAASPPPQAVALRTTAPRNDGVIHVMQGAAVASAAPASTRTASPARGARRGAKATASPVEWNDPFAEKKAPSYATAEPKKVTASHPSAMPNGAANGTWNDPFADGADTHKTTTRRAAPAASPAPASTTPARHNDKANEPTHAAGWKDPFTKAPAEPTHTRVAMRELGKNESSKWEIATHHGSSSSASASSSHTGSDAHASGGWGVIKKRAR
jgi:hypothetical protein